jgi:hypothetical protein
MHSLVLTWRMLTFARLDNDDAIANDTLRMLITEQKILT